MSIWDCEKPLDAMMLSHDHIAMLAVKHEQQIKDLAAHLLELKRLVTPMMQFKKEKSKNEPVAWLVTYGGLTHVAYTQPTQVVDTHYKPLYAVPPQREWVGLTVNEKLYSNTNYLGKSAEAWHGGVEWAEDKLKEKNT